MKRISILTFLALFAATLTDQGGAWAQDTKDDNWGQVPTASGKWTHITAGSNSGFELKDQYYYVSEDLTFTNTINGDGKGSGMYVQAGKTVNLYIPAGVTLHVAGADGQGMQGGGAGILMPNGTTLNIIGEGTIVARGGNAANGNDGKRGGSGQLDEESVGTWFLGKKIICGSGGTGGNGGGGAGAGIGTAGGNGGEGGSLTVKPGESYADWEGGDLAGVNGANGSAGTSADEMGTLYIQSTITQNIQGGAAGNGGAAGWPGNVSTTGGEIEFEGVEFVNGIPIPTFDITDMQAVAGGGGGGGGAGGGSAKAIGTGGAGGGGGASGAHGSACAHDSWVNDNWGSVGAGGGQGGVGTNENNGEDGKTCWFEGEDNIFDDEENHKPGGIGGASGSGSTSTTPGSATSPQYSVNYYTVGVTPSKSSENYNVSSSTKITLPSLPSGNYKWILSIYGNEAGKNTTSHCAGPNGDVYEPGDEVDLSNIYGAIEFCAVYVGCEIDCASDWSSSLDLAYSTEISDKYTVVDLKNRTLYKDGYWNTLTLPFTLSKEKLATTCLAGADIRYFKEASWDDEDQLTITFSDINEGKIEAGVPCIIRWTGENMGDPILNPSFTNVSIAIWNQEELDDEEEYNKYETESNGIRFQAQIAPVQVQSGEKALLLGGENKLYKPKDQMWVYATRAYFTYDTSSINFAPRRIVLDFGEDEQETTYIDDIMVEDHQERNVEGIFNLNGQRLDAPQKGINIINGKKVFMK